MSTNYYVRENECRACKRHEEIHIGKQSAGWPFTFQFNGGRYYRTIGELKNWLIGRRIYDEYGNEISKVNFWEIVEASQRYFTTVTEKESEYSLPVVIIDGYKFLDCEFC